MRLAWWDSERTSEFTLKQEHSRTLNITEDLVRITFATFCH